MICWQKLQRDKFLDEDLANGYPINTKASEFDLANETFNKEHKDFIKRYEWLGTTGFNVRYVFTARYKGLLAGVVIISEPNAYQFNKSLEALIQRGACASWTPKNLASRLIMFSCRWMTTNTSKRLFVAYSDSEAGEIGTVYQACNFDYLGNTFGSDDFYELPNGKVVNSRYFTRTSSMKRWAKELDIKWEKTWCKPNGFQDLTIIPIEILTKLRLYAKDIKNGCNKVKKSKKGKYILLLKNNKRELIEKSWVSLPYPKRK